MCWPQAALGMVVPGPKRMCAGPPHALALQARLRPPAAAERPAALASYISQPLPLLLLLPPLPAPMNSPQAEVQEWRLCTALH